MTPEPSGVPGSRPKATLFCPRCGREGVLGDDWAVRDDGLRRRYACPACGATVTTRGSSPAPA